MNTKEVAEKLVAYVQAGESDKAYAELYSPEIVSIENPTDGEPREDKGMDAIEVKGKEWQSYVEETHEVKASEPLIADKAFAVTYYMDITSKEGKREQMTELAVYQVKDGKVVQEEFIY